MKTLQNYSSRFKILISTRALQTSINKKWKKIKFADERFGLRIRVISVAKATYKQFETRYETKANKVHFR
jgi:hypothetical protein